MRRIHAEHALRHSSELTYSFKRRTHSGIQVFSLKRWCSVRAMIRLAALDRDRRSNRYTRRRVQLSRVLLWMCLRSAQCISIDHVELDMMPIQPEISPHQLNQTVQSGIIGYQTGREFLVEQGAARACMIHFRRRLEYGSRAMPVRALHRNAFRHRHVRVATVWSAPRTEPK